MDNPYGGGGGGRGRGRGGWNNRRPWQWMGRRGRGGRGRGFNRGGDDEGGDDNDSEGADGGMSTNRSRAPPLFAFGGNGNSPGSAGNRNNNLRNDSPPIPPPKKKRRSITTVKDSIIRIWKKRLPGYCLYYPESPPQLPDVDRKIEAIIEYLRCNEYLEERELLHIEEKAYFEVICEQVGNDGVFLEAWPTFLEDLAEDPAEVVNLWGVVMHKFICDLLRMEKIEEEEEGVGKVLEGAEADFFQAKGSGGKYTSNVTGRIHAGLMKLGPVVPFSKFNSSLIGKFVTLRGAVVGAGTVRAICLQQTFLCKICETNFVVDQPNGIYTLPTRCGVSEECDNRKHFETIEDAETTIVMESRKIKLQDVQNQNVERGCIAPTIDCELSNDMVHRCNTGDAITITGIVRMKREINFHGEQSLHNLSIEAIAVRNHKESERTMGGHWFSFSDKDFCAIREIYDTPNIFRLLMVSLCPSIYGHDFVKASIILSLFGGASNNDDILSRRNDINILMVGDPGIGKSQILKVVTEVAPRGVYVCGTGSTVAGLTVTLVRDGDEYSLEAGALVMADRGICCIDEFDKMQPQHAAMLEAMEQQSVSIAKAGVFRTLPARTTVIAAANPVGGHYDKSKSVIENIKISSPLLSRFDVIFILLDKPNQDFDRKMVEHIMGRAHSLKASKDISASQASPSFVCCDTPLIDRLKVSQSESLDLIPHGLMRKYIAYARQYVKPKLSPEAACILKEYYLKLRVKHRSMDSTPITTRQLESLMRLTEARAKVELREIATADDAKDVLEIFESSLSSAFDDEVIAVSALSESILLSTPVGKTKSVTRNQAKKLVATLQSSAELQSKNIFTVNEIKQTAISLGIKNSVESLIASLNNEGYLIYKGGQIYQLQTAVY